jgi:hypothetical protein
MRSMEVQHLGIYTAMKFSLPHHLAHTLSSLTAQIKDSTRSSSTMAEATTKKIAIITGSTRAVRIGPQVAKFITEILEANLLDVTNKGVKFSISQVDIASFKLPVFDEAVIPATVPMFAQFEYEHSKAWSAEISKYDGYVRARFSFSIR